MESILVRENSMCKLWKLRVSLGISRRETMSKMGEGFGWGWDGGKDAAGLGGHCK